MLKRSLVLFVLSSSCLMYGQVKSSSSLAHFYKDYFSVGVALGSKLNSNQKAQELIVQNFNSITAENLMKPQKIVHPKKGYDFSQTDKLVNFARRNTIKMRGHVLVWHKQTPDWFFEDDKGNNLSEEQLYNRLYEYMNTVMTRYKNDVYAWDVVNEVISDEGDFRYRTKETKWFDICEERFIGKAFRIARSIDSDVRLFYNDYNLIDPVKRDKTYEMLKELLAKGVPIDGIGMQAHWYVKDDPKLVEAAIEKFASLGLEIQITELDLSMYKFGDKTKDLEFTTEKAQEQAIAYKKLFEIFKKHSEVITNVTFWGLNDATSWLNNFPVKNRRNYPLLFDDQLNPKPAYYAIIE